MHKVSIMGFPLRADMARLRRFIDSYLNFIDDRTPPPFYFQPMAPYVLFELMHYPYLAVTTRNLVAYPQHEIAFTIPLECYAIEDGTMVFKQYALCSPFIYVDQEMSIVSGRDIFGLPKIALSFPDVHPQDDPRTSSQLALLKLRIATPRGDRYIPFIEVFRDPPRFVSMRDAPRDLLKAFPDAMSGYLTSVANTWETMTRSPFAGYDPVADTQSMMGRSRASVESFLSGLPVFPFFHPAREIGRSTADILLGPLYSDIISLKQERDAEKRDCVSFQSIVRSTMYLDRLNDLGSLSSPGANDSHGGITIKLHKIATQPVIETLGLEVVDEPIITERKPQQEAQPTTLKPDYPYWLNVDLTYGLGTNLYWRGRDTVWSPSLEPGSAAASPNRYLTFGGGASQEDPSHLISPRARFFILTLPLADGGKQMESMCRDYLENDRYAFRLYRGQDRNLAPFVWMIIRNLVNTGEGKGPDLERMVEFCALVEWFEKRNDNSAGEVLGVALLPTFVFSDCQSAVFTESELLGRPTVLADIDHSTADWTSPDVEWKMDNVLRVRTLVSTGLYSGGVPENRELVRITARPDLAALPPEECPPSSVLEIPWISLKQVVDCRTPEGADYQALVMQVVDIQRPADLDVPSAPFSVRIYKYDSVPLVEKMGLLVDHPGSDASTTIEVVRVRSAGIVEAAVHERGAINFGWRLGNSSWTFDDPMSALEALAPGIRAKMKAFVKDCEKRPSKPHPRGPRPRRKTKPKDS